MTQENFIKKLLFGEGLFIRNCTDRTRSNEFKLEEGEFRLDIRKKFLTSEGGETLKQVIQRSGECPIPDSVQGRVGWGIEQPGLVETVPAHGSSVGTR